MEIGVVAQRHKPALLQGKYAALLETLRVKSRGSKEPVQLFANAKGCLVSAGNQATYAKSWTGVAKAELSDPTLFCRKGGAHQPKVTPGITG